MAKQLQRVRALFARLIASLVFSGPVVLAHGRGRWVYDPKTGRILPPMAGADGDGDKDGDGDGDKDGDGDGDGDKDGDADKDGDKDGDADKDGDGDGDGDEDEDGDKVDWRAMSRKHERRAKAEKKRADKLAAEATERSDATKSEQQKAIDKAKQEGRAEAETTSRKGRRADRLEVAVTRHATRGIKMGTGDDAETHKFADPDDALVHLNAAIARGDVDEDDIFDDEGKVQKDGLNKALAELLEDKPHLRADANSGSGSGSGRRRTEGDGDGGKGKGSGKAVEDLDPEEWDKRIRKGD